MSERPTPETDALILLKDGFGATDYEWREHSRRLERERDEALMDRARGEIVTVTINHYECILRELYEARLEAAMWALQRDEARAEIQRLRYDAQREAEHHDRMVKELESLYDKLKS